MPFTCGFYNSQNGDRKYNSRQISQLFDGLIADGVFATVGDALMVSSSVGMNVSVGMGRAWFNGTWSFNSTDMVLTVEQSDLLLDRIDAVVLEVNIDDAVRDNQIKIVKGVAAASPVAPTLIQDGSIYQYALAHIAVDANVVNILTGDITNMVGTTGTPFVTGIIDTIDANALYNQWDAQFNIEMADWNDTFDTAMIAWDDEFQTWFNGVKDQIAGDLAASLQVQIDKIKDGTDKVGDADKLDGYQHYDFMKTKLLSDGQDLNNVTEPGVFKLFGNSNPNSPHSAAADSMLLVMGNPSTTAVAQIIIDNDEKNMWFRGGAGGTWQPWSKVYSTNGGTIYGDMRIEKTTPLFTLYTPDHSAGHGRILFSTAAGQNVEIRHEISDGLLPEAGTGLIISNPEGSFATHINLDGEFFSKGNKLYHAANPQPSLPIIELGSAKDLNDYITPGMYHQDSNAEASSGSNYPLNLAGLLEVYSSIGGSFIYQRYTTYNDPVKTFVRVKYSGAWTPWNLNLTQGSGAMIEGTTHIKGEATPLIIERTTASSNVSVQFKGTGANVVHLGMDADGDVAIKDDADLNNGGGKVYHTNKKPTYEDVKALEHIDLGPTVQQTSYRKSVVALCELTNDVASFESWSIGKLIFQRTNTLSTPPIEIEISMGKRYNTTIPRVHWQIKGAPSIAEIKPCTFTYNGVKYGGLHFFYSNAQHGRVAWHGDRKGIDIFGLDYVNVQSGETILNSEVYNSIDYDDKEEYRDFYMNGKKISSNEEFSFYLPSSWSASGDYFYKDIAISGLDDLKDTDEWDIIPNVSGSAQNKLLKKSGLFAHSNFVNTSTIRVYAETNENLSAILCKVIVRRK